MGTTINRTMQLDTTSTTSKLDTLEPLLEAWGERLDPDLLILAMAYWSFSYEHGKTRPHGTNERPEFLGDTVLQIIVTEYLYQNFPDEPKGTLARMRAATVSQTPLAEMARKIRLGEYLQLGAGEDHQGGRNKDSILSDTLEALIGATFLSCGLSVTRVVIERHLRRFLHNAPHRAVTLDWRTTLQGLLSAAGLGEITYKVVVTGPGHQKHSSAQALVRDENWGEGQRSSKKIAEHQAAEAAIATLVQRYPGVVDSEIRQGLSPGGNPDA